MKLQHLLKKKEIASRGAIGRALDRLKKVQNSEPEYEVSSSDGALRKTMHRCNQHDKPFMVIWEKNPGASYFTVKEIIKLKDAPHARGAKGEDPAKDTAYSAGDFDATDRDCPHCGWRGNFVDCYCGTNVCGRGTQTRDGIERFTHHRCGAKYALKNAATFTGSSVVQTKQTPHALPNSRRVLLTNDDN